MTRAALVLATAWLACGCAGAGRGPQDSCRVEAGSFLMGCDPARDPACFAYERPCHRVELDAYRIGRTEVTQRAYAGCVEAGDCQEPSCNFDPAGHAGHPVACVTWEQAGAYCRWAGGRLCTEAEWERAARGDDQRLYPWGDGQASCTEAVMDEGGAGCGTGGTLPVGSRPAGRSPCGADDMAGNVSEWVSDWFATDAYPVDPVRNPAGPATGTNRVIRGGGFGAPAQMLRSSYRAQADPAHGYHDLGIRCCWR